MFNVLKVCLEYLLLSFVKKNFVKKGERYKVWFSAFYLLNVKNTLKNILNCKHVIDCFFWKIAMNSKITIIYLIFIHRLNYTYCIKSRFYFAYIIFIMKFL